ncbi:hypothetical protein AN2679.2 [Aspergillus nidulans FGSC A4]|uniref:Uncharacterized protein n=1 Tax=Emericella nidulans (strain FGSC A4 / ATCC 38163 / CBS 112.46 / NRRL 194 / M139) TaxID=227321 RepID=Q5B9V1_EMENI|nr:hypothetical protein [Aspergillus nidulans FGSC A4]EAA63081.1 hypothetical protein AN2679.2 [Aspergillus nidulans FGSC A4]CBF84224.1 TPA: conserved hypothetical protein [Aspergillus nidulans FGSC A4]|eukprot:XP_660283.1 hypothetical protein AN2679.2 [Aspergillus nidulans FGSC A4]
MAVGDAYKARQAQKQAAEAAAKANSSVVKGKGAEIEHVEALASGGSLVKGKLGKRQRLKRHFARFWCCYLLAGTIFLAIFLPVFFLVAIPAIAQRLVEDTSLPVYGAHITNPKPDALTFTLDSGLSVPLGLSVRLDPFKLDLFNRDSDPEITYLTIQVPEYKIKGKTNLTVTSENTPVWDEDEFVKALTKAVYSKRFTLSALGKTTGHLGAIKAGLTLDKDVELDGLDKLSGFSIDEAALLIPAMGDGSNLRGKATLPNHSVVTFALGNVTLNLKSGDIFLGTALLPDVTLLPGDNSVGFTGKADITSALANIGSILSSQADALRNGEVELSASGNQTIFNGEHIPYFERVLNDLTITARVSILKILLDTVSDFLGEGSEGVIQSLTEILNKIDFAALFEGVDFDSLVGSVGEIINNLNLGQLLDGIDLNEFLQGIDWAKVVHGLGSILEQLDLGAFFEDLDVAGILQSIDWTSLLQGVASFLADIDWSSLATTLSTIVSSVDWSSLSEQLQPILEKLDIGSFLSNIDWDAIFDSIGPIISQIDLGAIFEDIDWSAVLRGLGEILTNVDLGQLFRSLLDALSELNLGDLFDIDIGGVNISDVLGGIAGSANGTSVDEAWENLMDALENFGSSGNDTASS